MSLRDRLVQQPAIATAIAVQNRYRVDAADQLAAAISFFGFVSVFPLLTLALAGAGYVLDDPEDQVELALTLTDAIPGFEALLSDEQGAPGVAALIENVVASRRTIGAIGLVTLLVSGLKVVASAMTATRVVFRATLLIGVRARVRQLLAMLGLGMLALMAVGGSSIAGTGLGLAPPVVTFLLALAVTFALDFVLFLGAYTLLSPSSSLSVRRMVPGALFAAVGWSLLKVAGASYFGRQVESANALYGALGGVIGLLLLFYVGGRLYLYGAELSAVLAERRDGPLRRPDPAASQAARAAAAAAPGAAARAAPGAAAGAGGSGGRDREVIVPDRDDHGGRRGVGAAGRRGVAAGGRRAAGAGGPRAAGAGGRRVAAGTEDPDPRPAAGTGDPSPRPVAGTEDPGPWAAPTFRDVTRARSAAADEARRTAEPARDRGADARRTIAIGLAAAALATAWRFLGPRRR